MESFSKRALSLMLFSAIAASQIVSCGSENGQIVDDKTQTDTQTDSGTSAEESSNESVFPDVDYGGEEILFLTYLDPNGIYTSREIYAESETGELINDAVYRRNMKVEDRFNVRIAEDCVADAAKQARNVIMAGDDIYDVMMPCMNDSIANAVEGLYYDLKGVENLHLENPWWDQRANEELAVGGRLYFTTGDISILDNECMMVLFFNKQLIENNNLDNPYDLVKNGTWTLDKLFAMSETVSNDLNGDSEMNIEDDCFGLYCYNNVPHSMWFGSGERISTADKDGVLRLTMGTERSSEIIPYILEKCQMSSVFRMERWSGDAFNNSISAFMDGRILFAGWALTDINYIRDCRFDFGILPYPKYDEVQKDYHNLVSTVLVPGVSIPVTNAEPEKAGLILEAMAYYSVDTLTTAYYDNALNTRYIRDEESGDMLDIIFATRVYDLGYINDVGGLGQLILSMFTSKSTNFMSRYKSLESKAQSDLDKLMAAFNEAAEK